LAVAFWGIGISVAEADVTLVYQLTEQGAEPVEKKLSLSRYFVRVDDPSDKDGYLLFQAGKFFPLYHVDESRQTYTRLTPPVHPTLHAGSAKSSPHAGRAETQGDSAAAEAIGVPQTSQSDEQPAAEAITTAQPPAPKGEPDETTSTSPSPAPTAAATDEPKPAEVEPAALPPSPVLKPTRKTHSVAGIECRAVVELIDDEPAVEHCMANKARLGITERESRTLARVFVMARKQGLDWLGAATPDENLVSVQSRDLRRNKTLELKSISKAPLPSGYLAIPRSFKEAKASAEPKQHDSASEQPSPSPLQPTANAQLHSTD